jgi:hypothetical protein
MDKVDEAAREMEKEQGKYLDQTDFSAVNDADVEMFVSTGKRTIEELFDKVKEWANAEDDKAVVLWIQRFVKRHKHISTKNGIVQYER